MRFKTRHINVIGASAYSSVGGIQSVNRMVVAGLVASGLLRRAFFLWDDPKTASAEGLAARARGQVSMYSRRRRRFSIDLFRQTLCHPQDLWLCTHVNYVTLGYLTSCFRGHRLGVMLHAAEIEESLPMLKMLCLRRAGHVFPVSDYTKKKAIRLGIIPERLLVLHNGVDDPCPAYQPRVTADGSQTVLFVGRMDESYKGQMTLLEAMELLQRRFPMLRLVFVGGGKTLDEWRAEASKRGLDEKVQFVGQVSDAKLKEYYDEATLFAMPSENEGFGLVFAEAMAHGLPCIGSDWDAAGEVIANGETGLCVPARNPTALADAIGTVLRSPELRLRMGEAGRRRYLKHFTEDAYHERLLTQISRWRTSFS